MVAAAVVAMGALPARGRAQGYALPSTCRDGCMTVTAYFDHAAMGVTDHACSGHSYDGHRGTDFAPYGGFAAMDAGRAVTAAAPGTVIAAHDGEFDRCTSGSCAGGGGFGNYVAVAQDDGVTAYYAHMKLGSPRVPVGARVSCGQELGLIGSSGYSTGVHVHFETRRGGVASDPFGGGCSGASAWAEQGPYRGLPRAVCAAPPVDPPPEPPPEEPPPEPPPEEPPPEPPAPACVPESCNAADDDCDGSVDEAPECAAASVRFAEGGLPLAFAAGTTTRVALRLRNDGSVAWSPDEHWAEAAGVGIGARVSRGISTGVAPGAEIEIELTVVTTAAGRARVVLYLRRGPTLATAIWLWTVDVLEGATATESAPVDPPAPPAELDDPPPAPDAGPAAAEPRAPRRSPAAPPGCGIAAGPARAIDLGGWLVVIGLILLPRRRRSRD